MIRGLQAHDRCERAAALARRTIELVEREGPREHYHPLTGEGGGARDFTWSAALALDLIERPVT